MLFGAVDAQRDAAMQTLDQGLRAAETLLELDHTRRDTDRVQAERVDLVALLPLQESEEPAARTFGGGLDGAQGVGPSDGHRQRNARVDHHVPEDDDGQFGLGAGRPRRQGRLGGGRLGGQGLQVGLLGTVPVVVFGHVVVASLSGSVCRLFRLWNGADGRSYSISLKLSRSESPSIKIMLRIARIRL